MRQSLKQAAREWAQVHGCRPRHQEINCERGRSGEWHALPCVARCRRSPRNRTWLGHGRLPFGLSQRKELAEFRSSCTAPPLYVPNSPYPHLPLFSRNRPTEPQLPSGAGFFGPWWPLVFWGYPGGGGTSNPGLIGHVGHETPELRKQLAPQNRAHGGRIHGRGRHGPSGDDRGRGRRLVVHGC